MPQALQDRIPGRADVTEQIKEAIRWLCALGFLPDCSQHHVFRSIAVKHFQLLCFLPQPTRKLSKQSLKSQLLFILMDKEIFQLCQLFPNSAGTRLWQRYNMRKRNNRKCFASGVSSVVFSVNNRDIRRWIKCFLGNNVSSQN